MNKKLSFFTIMVILVFASFGNTSAQTQEVGVHVGNVFVYDISETANGQINNWSKGIRVNSISGSLISVTDIDVFENGTSDSEHHYMYEVSTSASNPYFFFANLNVSDPVYVTEQGAIRVNETVSRSYASGSRETNYIIYNYWEEEDLAVETYFDKQTGVLVESIQKHPPTGHEIQIKLTETNVWLVAESPSPTETPSPTPTAIGNPTPTPTVNVPTPTPSASITPTPDSKSGIFLPFETLYVIIAVIVVVVVVAVLTMVFKRRKK